MYPAGLDTSSMKSKHTDEQLGWLRNHLADYETRASGNVRGDAKKFALEMASKYIEKWGVPEGEKETTVREVRLCSPLYQHLAAHVGIIKANLYLVQEYVGQRQGGPEETSAHEEYDHLHIPYLVLKHPLQRLNVPPPPISPSPTSSSLPTPAPQQPRVGLCLCLSLVLCSHICLSSISATAPSTPAAPCPCTLSLCPYCTPARQPCHTPVQSSTSTARLVRWCH